MGHVTTPREVAGEAHIEKMVSRHRAAELTLGVPDMQLSAVTGNKVDISLQKRGLLMVTIYQKRTKRSSSISGAR